MSDQQSKIDIPTKPTFSRRDEEPGETKPPETGFLRSLLTREGFLGGVRTLAWVLPLTILIWAYAEREEAVTETVVVPVNLQADQTDRVLTIRDQTDNNIAVELKGPRAGIQRLKDQIEKGLSPVNLRVVTQGANPNETLTVSIASELKTNTVFQQNALEVIRTQPPNLRVSVDLKETRELPVVVSPEDSLRFGKVTIKAPAVKITAPHKYFATLATATDGEGFVYARLEGLEKYVGQIYDGDVPIYLPVKDDRVEAPSHVKARVDIPAADMPTLQIPSVPIYIDQRYDEVQGYRVELQGQFGVVPNVWVKGPARQIDMIKSPSFAPRAIVHLSIRDRSDAFNEHELTKDDFNFPEDVNLIPPPGDPGRKYTVGVRIVPE